MNEFSEKTVRVGGLDLKIKIDRYTCIGSANCINAAPDFFELDDERICAFKELKDGIEKEKIIEACTVCPVNALYVYDKEGKQIVP
jgi:ferredoxin